MIDKRLFCPCPECRNRMYEYDSGTFDDEAGHYLFNFKCSKCKRIYNNSVSLNKNANINPMELLGKIMNPLTLSKMVKSVQKEIDKDE